MSTFNEVFSGGVAVAGLAMNAFNEVFSGGVVVAGLADNYKGVPSEASGGVTTGGLTTFYNLISLSPSGGVQASGTADVNVVRTLSFSGGILLAGKTIIGEMPYIGGGISVAGSLTDRYVANISGTNGGTISGSGRVTFFDWVTAIGGIRVGGKARIERIKYRPPSYQTGIGRSITGSILAIVEDDTEELMTPYTEIDSVVENVPVRTELTGVWCDVEEACEEGVLPEIVKKRQGNYLPPKKGTVSARDRGFATSS